MRADSFCPFLFRLQLGPDDVIRGLEVEKGSAFADHHVFDFRNEDRVIAGVLRTLQTTFEVSQRAVQDRSSVLRVIKACACFQLRTGGIAINLRIMLRNFLLVF